ncbi:protein of unknown function [Methylorubrum extorquens]|uniref:Uncharacterized protein n=1 Tax=Methylorubrum extorquens TaxID=408 RepID=A0A2N9AW97_METEX|nr:protein of unknown function [Methylorubrum extorquens]
MPESDVTKTSSEPRAYRACAEEAENVFLIAADELRLRPSSSGSAAAAISIVIALQT